MLLACLVLPVTKPIAAEDVPASAKPESRPFTGLLQFLDGSLLHGALTSVESERGIRWEHPEAKQPIDFRPANLSSIHFDKVLSDMTRSPYKCRFRFKNGDELFGNLLSLDGESVELESWLGARLKTPRAAVDSISFLSKGYTVLYEGPSSLEGWQQGSGQKPWQYRDGELVAAGVGLLGRDMKLTGSCGVEMDLAWNGNFSLVLILYTDTLNRFDYGVNTYMFYLGPGYISAQKVQANTGISQLGPQAQIPGAVKKSKMHLELRANKEEATFTVLVDGNVIQTWRDPGGFNASGKGIVFFSQMDGPSIRLSNLRVSEWDGKLDLLPSPEERTTDDQLRLINRDRVTGDLAVLKNGRFAVKVGDTPLEIPMERVTQLHFGGTNRLAAARTPWEVRTFLAGGGNISFNLEKWNEREVSGRSVNFGPLTFNSRSVRQVHFNLDRQADATGEAQQEDDWDPDK